MCPWCRNALPVLFDAAKENDVETIYYMNILNERDSYVVEDKKLVYAKDKDAAIKQLKVEYSQMFDGNPYNASWNCGVEGKTKKKAVLDLRLKQMKNAFLLTICPRIFRVPSTTV